MVKNLHSSILELKLSGKRAVLRNLSEIIALYKNTRKRGHRLPDKLQRVQSRQYH